MNQLFTPARQAFLTGAMDWNSMPVAMALIDSTYTFNEAHSFFSDIPATAIITSKHLAGEVAIQGFATAQPATFTALSSQAVASIVLFEDTGDAATSRLIAFYDEDPLPFVPTGFDYVIAADGIFGGFFRL